MTTLPLEPVTLASVAISCIGIALFVVVLFLGALVLPGPQRNGSPGPDGTIVTYRLNGLALFLVSLVAALLVQAFGPGLDLLARHVLSEVVAANLLAWPAALLLFLASKPTRSRRWQDFFFGVELAPSLCGIDLKMFSYRPSLIGLALLNLSFAALQFAETGTITLAMSAYQAMTLAYVANYFHFEHGMLFTWDIIEERFGWMLLWGDYVLVPFFYSLPAAFICLRPEPISWPVLVLLFAGYGCGFWMFRGANGQKHRFKQDGGVAIWGRPAETIGGRLLVSGFWGIGRKLNYTGELLMYLSWTALSGLQTPIPYLLPCWLAALLLQRAGRDERRCRRKYGALWEEYCRRVRFRMIPFVY